MEPVVVLGSLAVVGSLFVLWWAVSGERKQTVGLRSTDEYPTDMRSLLMEQGASERLGEPLLERLGMLVRRWSPQGRVNDLNTKIARAGSPPGWTVERVLAAKVLLAVALGLLGVLLVASNPSALTVMLAIALAVIGYFIPNGLLDHRAEARKTAIRAELSDTIDQLALMVRAGLGLDAAIARTARAGDQPLNHELMRVIQDIRVGVDRSVALTNMADRVDIPELRSFVASLAQSERLGVPVAQTLQIQADELRIKRRQLAEEQAMKLPVKILFPMVVCIFPALFIVLLGPAAIRIYEELVL